MKRLAFFIALIIGLNAAPVIRRAEEEEGQAIVQHDIHPSTQKNYISVFRLFTESIGVYFYLVTREGLFHKISWDSISGMIQLKQKKRKVTRIVYNLLEDKDGKKTEILIL
jgi:hypothetical protein